MTEAQAEQIVAQHYGMTARAQLLGSNQDCNFIIYDANDDIVGVLKIANPAFNATELEAQDAAADLIAEAEPSLRIAVPLPNVAGDKYTEITGLLDRTAYVRLLRYLPGGTLLRIRLPAAFGRRGPGRGGGPSQPRAGRVRPSRARPRPAVGPAVRRRRCGATAFPRRRPVATGEGRRSLGAAPGRGSARSPTRLPRQATHLDLTDANVVVTRGVGGAAHPDGVIDFGDLSHTWAVSELAITVSSVLGHAGSDPTSILPGVRAFHAIRPLSADGGGGAVADAGAPHRGADRQRSATGRPRPRQRLRHRADRRRDTDVRAGAPRSRST